MVEALVDFAAACRLSRDKARAVIAHVMAAVGRWRTAAAGNGITLSELLLFGDVFDAQLAALTDVVRG